MKQLIHLTVTLTIVAALAGTIIGYGNSKTKEVIAQQRAAYQQQALTSLFEENTQIIFDSLEHNDTITPYWVGIKNGEIKGYILKVGAQGYSSYISLLAAVTPKNNLLGISVLSQEETPGLGSRMTEQSSTETFWTGLFKKRIPSTPWFQKQFKGLTTTAPILISKNGEWHNLTKIQKENLIKKNSVTAITGATISTKAVCTSLQTIAPLITAINQKEGVN